MTSPGSRNVTAVSGISRDGRLVKTRHSHFAKAVPFYFFPFKHIHIYIILCVCVSYTRAGASAATSKSNEAPFELRSLRDKERQFAEWGFSKGVLCERDSCRLGQI